MRLVDAHSMRSVLPAAKFPESLGATYYIRSSEEPPIAAHISKLNNGLTRGTCVLPSLSSDFTHIVQMRQQLRAQITLHRAH